MFPHSIHARVPAILLAALVVAACAVHDGEAVSSGEGALVGNSADEGFPEANITVAIEKANGSGPACSGVLLTPTVVLTARPCLDNWDKAGTWPVVRVGSSFATATRYFSIGKRIQPGAPKGDSGGLHVNGMIALVYLDPRKPVLEAALFPHPDLFRPFPTSSEQAPDGSWLYANIGISGWGASSGVRQSAVFPSVPLSSTGDFGRADKPFWVRNASGSPQGLAGADLGGPLFAQTAGRQRQVVGIAISTGRTPSSMGFGICPASATACDAWVDITAEPNLSWIRSNLEIPYVLDGPTKSQRWFQSHPRAITRPDGMPDWWQGEVDYLGSCQTAQDADCDHWYDRSDSGEVRDNCAAWWNPSQEDADDDGHGNFCDNCPMFPNPTQEGGGPVTPPAGRAAEIHETVNAKYTGKGCGLWTQHPVDDDNPSGGPVWASSADDAWGIFGDSRLYHWNGRTWTRSPSEVEGNLTAITGFAANNVWATGRLKVAQYDGTRWTALPKPPRGDTFFPAYSGGPNDVWGIVLGPITVMLVHWNGTSWEEYPPESGPGAGFFTTWGSGPRDIWVGTPRGLYRWDGTSWRNDFPWNAQFGQGLYQIKAIWGSSSNDVWAAGEVYDGTRGRYRSAMVHWTGGQWTEVNVGDRWGIHFDSISGTSQNDVWATDYSYATDPATGEHPRSLWHWDGSSWSTTLATPYAPDGPVLNFRALPSGLWASANSPLHSQRKGRPQWVENISVNGTVTAITPTDIYAVYAFDDQGYATRWRGGPWVRQATGAAGVIRGAWARGEPDTWAVGDNGTVVHFDGNAWSPAAVGLTTNALNAISGTTVGVTRPTHEIWAVGANGTILRANDSVWATQSSGTTANLRAVWAASEADAWAAGDGNTMIHWDGTAWTPVPTGTSGATFRALWGTSASDIWAVGDRGLILHWDGATWKPFQSGLGGTGIVDTNFVAISGTGPKNVWAVTSNTIVSFNGTSWNRVGTEAEPSRDVGKFTSVALVEGPHAGIFVGSTATGGALRKFRKAP